MTVEGKLWRRALVFACGALAGGVLARAEPSAEGVEFFERRIRPILVQDCYECHRSGVSEKGGLALDHREAMLKGGRSGKVLVPGKPEESPLLRAIRHETEDLKMPKAGPKLEPAIIADFEKWVRMGAPDPRDHPAKDSDVATDAGWEAVMKRRNTWWSFQPVRKPNLPVSSKSAETDHPVDRFVRAKLETAGLPPAAKADQRTLLRRLSYVLRGLPPTPEELAAFENDPSARAYEKVVDAFLASPRFGERWARHWMDWVRYADSHGSEGDPMIPYAWRYRDYLIRALNEDVPFDQLLREHLAGDLLNEPRINRELGLNESALGIGHLRMVLHGFAPTDALEERVRNIDDQIDVLSKAFLGLTVSCARCHNHKFDGISQADFYALYGVLASSTPASIGVDRPSRETQRSREELAERKAQIKSVVSEAWIKGAESLASKLVGPEEKLKAAIAKATDASSILNPLFLAQKHHGNVPAALNEWGKNQRPGTNSKPADGKTWNLKNQSDAAEWHHDGSANFSVAGAFVVAREGDRVVESIFPGGVYSHLTTSKDRAVLISPRFTLDQDYDLWLRVAGDGGAVARYVIQNYPRDGSIYPVTRLTGGQWRWVKHGMKYWTGDRMHVELSTAADQAVLADSGAVRSWFGVRDVAILRSGEPQPSDRWEFNEPLLAAFREQETASVEELARGYARALRDCAMAWNEGRLSDGQAAFLDQALQSELVDNSLASLPTAKPLVAAFRELENSLPAPVRAPGLIETAPEDQPLLVRGDHKLPGDLVPRRFLEAFGSTPYPTKESGRRELAEDFLGRGNSLTSRVIVNRLWHHLFGRGIVGTPDNFGRLGETPSHPEMLDFLAGWFVENGSSIKKTIRFLVLSETWQASSKVPAGAQEKDPENRLLSHAHVRRLEAEAIRDALLNVAGKLTDEMYGPPVLGTVPRRSVYVRVKRNDLDLLLSTFDAPVPSGTKGQRDVTNVPGQSLTLLNDPFVIELAERWANVLESDPASTGVVERVERLFTRAFGRWPNAEEAELSRRLIGEFSGQHEKGARERGVLEKNFQTKKARSEDLKNIASERVKLARGRRSNETAANLPRPMAAWDFRKGMRDQIGDLHGSPMGNARIESGALLLDGKSSYVATAPLPLRLGEKTLEAWVQLETLEQQGGGVMTVQDLRGEIFDSIVFGEKSAQLWIAGSDFFKRTSDFLGPPEIEAKAKPVHLAITYAADGTIAGYRNGEPYGKPYRSQGPAIFAPGDAQVLFGNRHGNSGGNRNLAGKIFRARLYDRALGAEEVAALARDDVDFILEEDLRGAWTGMELREYETIEAERAEIEKQLREMDARKGLSSPWANLAHALFNSKEFIYIR